MLRRNFFIIFTLTWAIGAILFYSWCIRAEADGAETFDSNRKREIGAAVGGLDETILNSNPQHKPEQQKGAKTLSDLIDASLSSMNSNIRFSGVVVDGLNKPLSGVQVEGHYRRWERVGNDDVKGKFIPIKFVTGNDGSFSLTNVVGDSISLKTFTKEGFHLYKNTMLTFGFSGNDLYPYNPNKPTPFVMLQDNQSEIVYAGALRAGVIPDGRFYTIDLLQCKFQEGVSTSADLAFAINSSTQIPNSRRYDWSFTLKGVSGKIQELGNLNEFRAPVDGYTNAYSTNFYATNQVWSFGVEKKFFFTSQNEKIFARLELFIVSDTLGKRSGVSWRYIVNTNASQNLESVPSKTVELR